MFKYFLSKVKYKNIRNHRLLLKIKRNEMDFDKFELYEILIFFNNIYGPFSLMNNMAFKNMFSKIIILI